MRTPPIKEFSLTLVLLLALLQPLSAAFISRSYFDLNQSIPDNNPAGLEIPFDFTGEAGAVGQIVVSFDGDGPCDGSVQNNFSVGIKHDFISDLKAEIISPSGQKVTLFSNISDGFGGRNLCNTMFSDFANTPISSATLVNAPFPGYWQPQQTLSIFQGQPAAGVWRLRLIDSVREDVGILQSVSIFIETSPVPGNSLPPQTEIQLPPPTLSGTQTFDGPSVTFTGTASDFGNSLARVEYGILNSEVSELDFQPALNISGDWTQWSVTLTLPIAEETQFIVRAVNTNGDIGAIAQRAGTTLFVPDSPPLIAVTTPATDALTSVNRSASIYTFRGTASSDGPLGLSAVQFRQGTTGSFQDVFNFSGAANSNWQYNFRRPATLDVPVVVQFRVRDGEGFLSDIVTRNIVFTTSNQTPTVTIIDPATNENFTSLLNSRVFRGTAVDPDGTIEEVQFRIPINETELDPEIWTAAVDVSGDDSWLQWQFTADFDSTPTTIDVLVRAIDNAGAFSNPVASRTLSVITNGPIRPEINITNPTQNLALGNTIQSVTITGTIDRKNVSLETSNSFSLQQIARLSVINSGGTTQSIIQLDPPSYNTFTTTVPLAVGTNTISVSATNKLGFSTLPSGTSQRIITRAAAQQTISPSLTVVFPALISQTVPNTQQNILVSGRTTAGTFPIQTVLYQLGPDSGSLSAEAPVTSVSGNFAEWSIQIPLQVYNNLVTVVAVDTQGNRSPVSTRTVRRSPRTPSIFVISPPNNGSVAEGETTAQVSGTTTDPDGAIGLLQYRVTTADRFFNPAFGNQRVTFFQPVVDNSDAGDWSTWTFNAPLGPGINTIEIRALDENSAELTRISTIVLAPLGIKNLYLVR